MLKTPRSLQQCSSSPINGRRGSDESVVLPVPGEAEEERDIALGALVGAAMHRQHAAPAASSSSSP